MINQLQEHLEPIARDHRQWQFWRKLAVCWATAALLGIGLLFAGWYAGWASRWTWPVLAGAALVAAVIIAFGQRKSATDYRALARRIEQEHPQLRALLLTAVEQKPLPPVGELNYLQQRVIAEALEHDQQNVWGERIHRRLRGARWTHWLSFACFAVVLFALRPSPSSAYGLRSWAARSGGISVTPGDTSIERGSGLVVLARFDGRLPAEATLVIKPVNEVERRVPLVKNLDDPVFGGSLPEVKSDMAYRIEFPAGQTRDFKVAVFDYPQLERADVKLAFPQYTGLPEKVIQDTRRVSAVEGTGVAYTFILNKPVTSAKLLAKDKSGLTLEMDTNNPSIYHTQFTLDQNRRYELVLVDAAGRTNKMPPEFVLAALTNQPPELKLASPRGDQRVSPLEEISFQADVSDDFGLRAYGIAYSFAGKEPTVVELGHQAGAHEKRQLKYMLALEGLGAQPDQLLSYYVWADDLGPDGKVRRTASDMYFAEIRPFDEIFREGQSPDGGNNSASEGGGQQGNQTQKLVELQKQIISATWNLKRRGESGKPTEQYPKDVAVVHESQQSALEQARARKEELEDPRLSQAIDEAVKEMDKAARSLSEAQKSSSVAPLSPALTSEQAASQALLRLQAREHQVARGRNRQSGGGGGAQMAQRQIDQLDLKQTENRYETQRQAASAQTRQQREQLQVLNRLKELAQRQQDLNERLKELQASLQEAKTEAEREDVRRRLKRLREEQQQMLADVDELRQRMERPENQSSMAEARQQLEQTRSEVQNAADALQKESAAQALASGTRAQRDLQQLRDDFRKKTSGEFAEDMRRMRNDARQLAQKEEQIAKQIEEHADPKQKTLNDSDKRKELADQLAQQKGGLTNLITQMRQVSEQAEAAEPLLSQQLYDMLRQTRQDEMNKSLDTSGELVRRGFVPQASQFERRARQGVDELKRGVEHAAESVLGDEAEALRLAKRELDDLSQQLDRELAQARATDQARTNAGPRSGNAANQGQSGRQSGSATNALAAGEGPDQQTQGQSPGGQSQSGQPGERGQQTNAGGQSQSGERGQQANAGGQGQQGQRGQRGQRGSGAGQSEQANAGDQSQPGERGQQANAAGQGQQGQRGQRGQQGSGSGQSGQGNGEGQAGQGNQGGGDAQQAAAGNPQGGQRASAQETARGGNQRPGQRNGGRGGTGGNFWDRSGGNGGDPLGGRDGDSAAPLTGEGFVEWSDRLRDVEEMLDAPELRTQIAQIRDRARAVRQEYKRLAKQPDWNAVRLKIATPLAEVRSRVGEELARRDSNEALVPIDRDPVPAKFSELVRRYYEQLGKSD